VAPADATPSAPAGVRDEASGPVTPDGTRRLRRARPELLPRLPLARAAGWVFDPEPEPDAPVDIAGARLEAWLLDQLDADGLGARGADAWYHDVGRAMRRAFRPDLEAMRAERQAPMGPVARLRDELGRYAPGPGVPQGSARAQVAPEVSSLGNGAAMGRETARTLDDLDARSFLNAPTTWTTVEVRVVHAADGGVAGAWVERSSGLRALDQAALEAVRAAVEASPPPARLVAGRDAVRSDWRFEAGDVATRVTDAGCVDDPVHGGVQCARLGRGLVRTRVRLLRVVDATRPSPAERRARARASPPRLRAE
jgi:TonB family protein